MFFCSMHINFRHRTLPACREVRLEIASYVAVMVVHGQHGMLVRAVLPSAGERTIVEIERED